MKGHLRLLNIACAAKAKWRQVTLQKASRESPLNFSVQGGSERGFGIFVESVEAGSKAAEAGLKRGDQVRGAGHTDGYYRTITAAWQQRGSGGASRGNRMSGLLMEVTKGTKTKLRPVSSSQCLLS